MNKLLKRIALCLCATTFFALSFGVFSLYSAFAPYCHVVVDTDASVELVLNRHGTVIVHRTYHKYDAKALSFLNLRGLSASSAVGKIVTLANSTNAFDKDARIGVFLSVSAKNSEYARQVADRLGADVNSHLSALGAKCRCYVAVCPENFLAFGHLKDVSPGKLCMIALSDTTSADPPEAVYDRLLNYPSRRLMRRVADELEKARYGATFWVENVPV